MRCIAKEWLRKFGIYIQMCGFVIIGLLIEKYIFIEIPITRPVYQCKQEINFDTLSCHVLQRDIKKSCESRCVHGECFLHKCFCRPGYSGQSCDEKSTKIPTTDCTRDMCWHSPELGVPVVSMERWLLAQTEEASLWANTADSDDGSMHHAAGFDNYKLVTSLGKYIEVGCGPFTQTKHMFKLRPDLVDTATSISLLDPNIFDYVQRNKNNAYRDGKILGRKVTLIGGASEHFDMCGIYDTIYATNVLEHVINVYKHLETIYFALKPNGQIIWHDRAFPGYIPEQQYTNEHRDWLFHPIRIETPILEHFIRFFEPTFCEMYRTHDPLSPMAYYLIGRRRPDHQIWKSIYYTTNVTVIPPFECSQGDEQTRKSRYISISQTNN